MNICIMERGASKRGKQEKEHFVIAVGNHPVYHIPQLLLCIYVIYLHYYVLLHILHIYSLHVWYLQLCSVQL